MRKEETKSILAIETSCDDTCIAILQVKGLKIKILSNIVSSQVELHAKYGGVYPFLAKREHQKNIIPVFKEALKNAGNPIIDVVAVTIGPGLEPCLWVGVNFARALSKEFNLPIIPINHIEAHIFANFLPRQEINFEFLKTPEIKYIPKENITQNIIPAICLVVSGGHTQLILMNKIGKYKILGETRDDAAGECFDKTARVLEIGYPGGPAIAKAAEMYNSQQKKKFKINLPRPMIHQKNYDFSFSGLKTAVLYNYKSQQPKIRSSKEYIQAMAAEIQQSIIDVLTYKTIKAAKAFKAKSIILGGGVSSNEELRKQFREKIRKEKLDIPLFIPSQKFCTDNASMVGITAFFKLLQGNKKNWKKIKVNANLKI